MFKNFMKGNTPPQAPPPSLAPTPIQEVFEVGKEVMTRDPKTGEFIYRMAMSPENRKKIFDVIQKNANVGQQLISMAMQQAAITRQLEAIDKGRIETEKAIEAAMTQVRDEMKIPRVWGLNMQMMMLERREPPEANA